MRRKQYRVAMVDDDAEDIFAIRKGLENANAPIAFIELSSAALLFDYLNDEGSALPHLILVDINMPRMNGFEVLEKVKATPTWANIPIMVLSTSSHEADRLQSMRLGAAGFVTKFSSMKSLEQWVSTLEKFLEMNCNERP